MSYPCLFFLFILQILIKKRDICQWFPEACLEAIVTIIPIMGSTMSMHMIILMAWKRCMKCMMPECMTTVMTTVITWWKKWWCNTARYENSVTDHFFKSCLLQQNQTQKIFLTAYFFILKINQKKAKNCSVSWITLSPKTRQLWNYTFINCAKIGTKNNKNETATCLSSRSAHFVSEECSHCLYQPFFWVSQSYDVLLSVEGYQESKKGRYSTKGMWAIYKS